MNLRSAKSGTKTRTFSIRLTEAEHKRIRGIANKLDSNESTIIRFAIRSMLKRIGALSDSETSAYSLIPVFVESGEELVSFFDLDVARLDSVINGNTEEACNRIDASELALLAASGLGEPHVHARLREILSHDVEPGDVPTMLRGYFYEKYFYGNNHKTESAQSEHVAKAVVAKKSPGARRGW